MTESAINDLLNSKFDSPPKLEQAVKGILGDSIMAGHATLECTVGELAASIKNALVGGPFGSDLGSADYVAHGVPVIRGQNLSKGKFVGGEFVFVSQEKADKLSANLARPGDLVFTQRGTLGQVAIVPEHPFDRYLVSQSQMKLTADQTKVDPRFLYFIFTSADYRHYLCSNAIVTGVPHINLQLLREYALSLPPLAKQRAIAAVLGALDDKIELNRGMNATLEAMARALFQSWFVDFDPVRAKLDDRLAGGLDQATNALFPASFRESPIGPIPHGWTITTLREACEQGGGNIQTGPFGTQLHASDYVEEGIPSIMPRDLRDNRIDISSVARIRVLDAERLNVYRVQPGDIVYSRRGDVERRSLIRCGEDGWLCGTGCLRVRFGPHGLNPYFGASYLGTPESRAWVVRHAVGATMPNLNTSILGGLPMIVPPAELQASFAELVGPWDERGTVALRQSCSLASLRDTLLPKLLSGELSVSALESEPVALR